MTLRIRLLAFAVALPGLLPTLRAQQPQSPVAVAPEHPEPAGANRYGPSVRRPQQEGAPVRNQLVFKGLHMPVI